jgi:DNA invertase Pin-like site-specific DNA recombinase
MMSKSKKVTIEQREQIKMFSLAGMKQKAIAREVGLCRATVSRAQKQLGLSPHSTEPLSPEMVKKILDLCRQSYGAPTIANKLEVPRHRVEQVMRAFSFRQQAGKLGCRYFVSAEKKRVIRRMFREFENKIAGQFGVSATWVQRFWRRRA